MGLTLQSYQEQSIDSWPVAGRSILAQFDEHSVIVYQAYRQSIGHFAAEHQYFGGDFSLDRMTWVKPNFLWMMYRSNWGRTEGQEVVLAIRLARAAFDQILGSAVNSSFESSDYLDSPSWKRALKASEVRLQWDPDHAPDGRKLARRAIQLGLRGSAIAKYARDWILEIEDISDFVAEQRQHLDLNTLDQLVTPRERVYNVSDGKVAARLRLDYGGGPSAR